MKIQPIRSVKEWEAYQINEEERQKEALRKFYQREGPLRKVPMHVTGWDVFKWCLFTLAVAALLIYVIAEG